MSLFRASLGGLGLVALSACFVACGDDDEVTATPEGGDSGGSPSSGGKSGSGGTEGGVGGSSGGTTPEAGTGGAAPTTDGGGDGAVGDGAVGDGGGGTAFVKFCNPVSLTVNSVEQSVTFRLTIGTGATAVVVAAASGKCTPAVNVACTEFPAGTGIPVEMIDTAKPTVVLDSFKLDAADGDVFILGTTIDDTGAEPRPVVESLELPTDGGTCSSVDYDDLYVIQFNQSSTVGKNGYTRAR